MSILQQLVDNGVLTESRMGEIVKTANEKFGGDFDIAMKDLGVDEEKVLEVKSKYYGIPITNIEELDINTGLLSYIPQESVEHYKIAPLAVVDNVLHVGIVNPDNTEATDALEFISSKNNMPFKLFLLSQSSFDESLGRYTGVSGQVDKALIDLGSEGQELPTDDGEHIGDRSHVVNIDADAGNGNVKKGADGKIIEEAPVIKIVAVMLRHATEGDASDIHVENTGKEVKVRFRVDGELHTSLKLPTNIFNGVVARIKILAKLRLDEKRKPQDGGFSVKIAGRKVDYRVSTFPSYYGEKVVMRILDPGKGVHSLNDMDMSKSHRKTVADILKAPYGLILISGPTGSGKSTTLYSMLQELDREKYNVVSLEDPVEYQVEGVTQSQVRSEIGYTFANGLRSILRQDPDIIMVGEIRDKETAQLAIQAALTGHLVLSTIHTNTAIGVVPRLVDMGVDPYLIAPTLILAIAQRLARRSCEGSLQEVPFDESVKTMIVKQFSDMPDALKQQISIGSKMYKTIPTAVCPDGTKGRVAVFEMLPIDKDIERVILSDPTEQAIYKVARSKGMLLMKEDAIFKALDGKVPWREVYKF